MKRKLQTSCATIMAIAFLAAATPANAATANANLDVTATVTPACRVTTSPVAFGQIDVTQNTVFSATGGLSVTCTAGTAWTAFADQGQNSQSSGGSRFIRAMAGALDSTKLLQYVLWTGSARGIEWTATNGFTGVGTGTVQSQPVYASVPAGQTALPADDYSDIVVVDLEY